MSISSGTASSQSVSARPPDWVYLRNIKSRIWMEHNSPRERQITLELIVMNSHSTNPIVDFPLQVGEFLYGLKIIDEDGSVLPFYSRREIKHLIETYKENLKLTITNRLNEGYIVWIKLPNNKPIGPKDFRTIRLSYWGTAPNNPKSVKWHSSIFDIQQYTEIVPNAVPVETSYFITAPKDCILEVMKEKTSAYNIDTNEKLDIQYLDKRKDIATPNLQKSPIVVAQWHGCIAITIMPYECKFEFHVEYEVKLPKNERLIWQIGIPVSIFFLLIMVTLPMTPFFSTIYSVEPISRESIFAFAAIAGGIIAALMALINNALIGRTRLILLIDVGLIIALVLRADLFNIHH